MYKCFVKRQMTELGFNCTEQSTFVKATSSWILALWRFDWAIYIRNDSHAFVKIRPTFLQLSQRYSDQFCSVIHWDNFVKRLSLPLTENKLELFSCLSFPCGKFLYVTLRPWCLAVVAYSSTKPTIQSAAAVILLTFMAWSHFNSVCFQAWIWFDLWNRFLLG